MTHKLWVFSYFIAIIVIGFIHNLFVLGAFLGVLMLLGTRARWRIFLRAFMVLIYFNGAVTLSYCIYGLFAPTHPEALILINLRSFTITMMTFTLIHHVDIHQALSFAPRIAMLYALAYSQISLLQKLLFDYKDGIKSRCSSLFNALKSSHFEGVLVLLFGTMLHKTEEQNMGLRSRGFFDD
ncbi:MAG: hypothetical protein J7J31_00810 [Helicobacteraceae bacterium]|nr:hypothetical protein [Helicobacteraceae bacterium]